MPAPMRSVRLALLSVVVGLASIAPVSAQSAPGSRVNTARLAELTSQLRMAAGGSAPGLASIAVERRALLEALMAENAELALQLSIAASTRASLPAEVQALVEYETEVNGELEVVYEDRESGARLRRFLQTDQDRLELHFASEPAEMKSGDRVRVRGMRLDRSLAADGGSAAVIQVASAVPNTFGEQRVLMILVNFQDKPTQQPYTVSTASSLLFGLVSNFDRENSQDQTWLAGDVVGWFTIPVTSTVCDTNGIRTYAQQAAQAAGVALSNYRRFVYAFPSNSACSWWGSGQVGGSTTHAWINGSLATRVVAHELGHNLGVYHARAYECGATTLGSACSAIEYGDPADVMGMSGVVAHFNAFQKERMGWLNYGTSLPILTVQDTGTFVIEPYAAPGIGPKALKILKSVDPTTGRRTWYYVEYRRASGFDSSLSSNSNLSTGVVIHTGSESTGNSSYVLDMTPETSSWNDPALVGGRSFADPTAGVTITTVSAGTSGATVLVELGSPTCVSAAPTVTVTTSAAQMAVPGATLNYGVSVRSNNSAGCAATTYQIDAAVPSGWLAAESPSSVSLSPGASAAVNLSVTSASSSSAGSYSISITAADQASGLTGAASVDYAVAGTLAMTISTDKSVYSRNQTAKIAIRVTAGTVPLSGAVVKLTILKPTGGQVQASATTAADGTAAFTVRLKAKDPVGTYSVSSAVTAGTVTASAQTTFNVQ
jgi:M6 family metalloprotease-like protein